MVHGSCAAAYAYDDLFSGVKALEAQQNKDQADALQSEVDRLKKEGSLIEDEHKQLQETLATVQAERDKLRQQLAEKANHHWWEFWK